jgi:hypothetical protein
MNKVGKFEYCWIWLWYNDYFRLLVILVPSYLFILIPFLKWIGIPVEYLDEIAVFTYLTVFVLGLTFNDYSQLRKIGMDAYRRKLK